MRGRGDMSKQNDLPKTSLWLSVKTHKDVLNVKVLTDWGLIAKFSGETSAIFHSRYSEWKSVEREIKDMASISLLVS